MRLQVCDGATDAEREEWELLPAHEFKYLNKSSTYTLAGVNNAEEYGVRAVYTPPFHYLLFCHHNSLTAVGSIVLVHHRDDFTLRAH